MIYSLIWRNLWRNRRRTLITMTSVVFAVLFAIMMKSLTKGVFDNLVKNVVSFYSGYLQVHKSGYSDEQVLDNSFDFSDALVAAILKTDHVTAVVARLESFALASSDSSTRGCLVVGTQPGEENRLTGLKSKVVAGSYFSDADEAVLLSEGLAKRLWVGVGDTLVLLGQGYHGNTAAAKYPVKGILHYGSPQLNESLVVLPLAAAQNFLSAKNKITTLAINIDSPPELESTALTIESVVGREREVLTWKKMMPDIEAHIRGDSRNQYIFIGVLYLMIAFGIFGTMLMMLSERKYELGMLMAIGMKRLQLSFMFVGETFLISIFGTLFGMMASYPVVKYFEMNPIRIGGKMAEAYENFGFEALWPAAWDPGIMMAQAWIVLCITLVIGVFPLVSIQRMEAVNMMKK
jgi:putative ABC transport system permease protein